jgi:hypothetical protein
MVASGLDICGCGWGSVTVVGELGMYLLAETVHKTDSAAWKNLVVWSVKVTYYSLLSSG